MGSIQIPYTKVILTVFLVGFALFFFYDYRATKSELTEKKAQLMAMSSQIEEQNKAIQTLEVDVNTYKKQQPQVIEKVVTKYKNVQVVDNTCEAKLSAIYSAQQVFYNSAQESSPYTSLSLFNKGGK